MGQGGYIFCEWDSVQKEYPDWQRAFAELEARMVTKCLADWRPKTFGFLTPNAEQFGRTTIMPELFRGFNTAILAHWRQNLTLSLIHI